LNTYGDGKRFIVRADEKLSAFLELDLAMQCGEQKKAESSLKFWETTLAMLAARS
jgi:hypothetical protein